MGATTLPLALDAFSGRKLGKYEVLCRLSTGGMSEIFLAFQRGLAGFRKFVVLKQILPDIKGEEQFVRMFLDEAKITAAFAHPNIAQVYDLDIQDGELFLAMEFVPGATLVEVARACYDTREPIPMGFSLCTVRDTALALHYAHTFTDPAGRSQQVIHRDVAEKNIMVTYEGITKLLDFGIAKQLNRLSRTSIGTVKGTSGYMSPEQVLGKKLDPRSDVFSLGVVLHELLTGVRLFGTGKGNPEDELLAPVNERVAPPSRQNPNVPPELDAVVLKALAQQPEDRFATAKEFAREIERVGASWIWDSEQCGELIRRLFRSRREETALLLEDSEGQGDVTGFTKVAALLGTDSATRPEILAPDDAVIPFVPPPRAQGGRITAVMIKANGPTGGATVSPIINPEAASLADADKTKDSRTSPERPKVRNEWEGTQEAMENLTVPIASPPLVSPPAAAYRPPDENTERSGSGGRTPTPRVGRRETAPAAPVVPPPVAPEPPTSGGSNNGEGPTVMDPRPVRREEDSGSHRLHDDDPRTHGGSTNIVTDTFKERGQFWAFLVGFGIVIVGAVIALGIYLSARKGSDADVPQPVPIQPVAPAQPSQSAPVEKSEAVEPQPEEKTAEITKTLVVKAPAKAEKTQEASKAIDAKAAKKVSETKREPKRTREVERRGQLTLNTLPYSTVYLGSRSIGITPLFKVELPSGRHSLRLVGSDNKSHRLVVEIEPGETRKVDVQLKNLPSD